jgi:hypothetical protein
VAPKPADDQSQGEFAWRGHEEGAAYLAAVVSYVALGVALQSLVLNWIVGPLYFVCFIRVSSAVFPRLPGHRR